MSGMNISKLANDIRKDIVEMLGAAGSGHPGGSLSVADILAVLYGSVMRHDAKNPHDPGRDRLVLSKGHAAPALYAALAEMGYFPKAMLRTLRKIDSPLQGHPDMHKVPGVDMSTGSLGQGASAAVGMALAGHIRQPGFRVYAVLGDGELQEGIVWEACMAAAHYKLDNLTVVIDNNKLQIDGPNDEVMGLGDIGAKFAAFGFEAMKVNGHDIGQLQQVFAERVTGRPKCIIADTVKGRGVSFMENQVGWHGKAPSSEQVEAAIKELEANEIGR